MKLLEGAISGALTAGVGQIGPLQSAAGAVKGVSSVLNEMGKAAVRGIGNYFSGVVANELTGNKGTFSWRDLISQGASAGCNSWHRSRDFGTL